MVCTVRIVFSFVLPVWHSAGHGMGYGAVLSALHSVWRQILHCIQCMHGVVCTAFLCCVFCTVWCILCCLVLGVWSWGCGMCMGVHGVVWHEQCAIYRKASFVMVSYCLCCMVWYLLYCMCCICCVVCVVS